MTYSPEKVFDCLDDETLLSGENAKHSLYAGNQTVIGPAARFAQAK